MLYYMVLWDNLILFLWVINKIYIYIFFITCSYSISYILLIDKAKIQDILTGRLKYKIMNQIDMLYNTRLKPKSLNVTLEVTWNLLHLGQGPNQNNFDFTVNLSTWATYFDSYIMIFSYTMFQIQVAKIPPSELLLTTCS